MKSSKGKNKINKRSSLKSEERPEKEGQSLWSLPEIVVCGRLLGKE